MDYDRFITTVERATGVWRGAAERATRATLQTLADRISKEEALDLVEELPPELAPAMFTDGPAEGFDVDEFIRRVAEREGADMATAKCHAAISTEAYDDLMSQLPSDYRPLLPKANYHEPPSHQALLDWVSAQAKLDPDGAQRALDAVLETLAERIAPGEVDDLIAWLPVELHSALKRGKAGNPGRARHTPLDEFLALVARREGATPEQAFAHASAVMATLRDALEEEFFDVSVQLPPEYGVLWMRR
jgi:uncharacterized protein (DUF2267 family)